MTKKQSSAAISIVITLVLLFCGAHAAVASDGEGWIVGLLGMMRHLQEYPLELYRSGCGLNMMIFSCIAIGAGVFLYFYMNGTGRQKAKTMDGVECGSSQWFEDYPGYYRDYTSPKGSAKMPPDSDKSKKCKPWALYPRSVPEKETLEQREEREAMEKAETELWEKRGFVSPNVIFSKRVRLSLERFTMRNLNTLVIGGSGTGKSRFFVKPNILQANSSYVVTDPSGELIEATGTFLESSGYDVRVFNLQDMDCSLRYNPFDYIRDQTGVMTLVNCLISNTNPEGAGHGDPFWEKSETALLSALIGLIIEKKEEKEDLNCIKDVDGHVLPLKPSFATVMECLRLVDIDENAPRRQQGEKEKRDALTEEFENWHKKHPDSVAYKNYKTFLMGGDKTKKSVLISCGVRLNAFNFPQIEALTERDELDLASIGDQPTALFIIIPQANATFNFLAALMYSQLFETLYYHSEHDGNGHVQYHIRFLLDEFANVGQIPNFTKVIATVRKHNISCSVILQNLAQIQALYDKDWGTIVGNCDSILFLGGQEDETTKFISEKLGDATILTLNTSNNGKGGKSTSKNKSARKLMDAAELSKMSNNECIYFLRGLQPFKDNKYEITEHPNYELSSDKNGGDTYDLYNQKKFSIPDKKAKEDRLEEARSAMRKMEQLARKSAELRSARASEKDIGIVELNKEEFDETVRKAMVLAGDPAKARRIARKEERQRKIKDDLERMNENRESGYSDFDDEDDD